jgi:hypothetical protein
VVERASILISLGCDYFAYPWFHQLLFTFEWWYKDYICIATAWLWQREASWGRVLGD